jgi:probable rRNA maturation factor
MSTPARRVDALGQRATITVANRQRLLRIDTALLKKIASHVLAELGAFNDSLSIVLVNDATIAEFNSQYHHVEGPTDILSFDYEDGNGELIVSVEHAKSQAKRFRSTPSRELALYVVHGILHLHGHDDRTPRQRTRMRTAERRLLAELEKTFTLRKLVG